MSSVQIIPTGETIGRGRLQHRRPPTTTELANNIAAEAWSRIIGMIADGVQSHKAIEAVGATRALVEGMLRSSPERKAQWDQAKVAAERRHWDVEMVTEICNDIAAGLTVKAACKKHERAESMFIKLVLMDQTIREEYELARKIRSELWADETIEIADDDGNDMNFNGTGNSAAVKRSDVRISARRQLMQDFSRERFGSKAGKGDVNIQVNVNAAERLEAARARRNSVRKAAAQDAEFTVTEVAPGFLND